MWFIGVQVEQETSAPPPRKNPGSAPISRNAFAKKRFVYSGNAHTFPLILSLAFFPHCRAWSQATEGLKYIKYQQVDSNKWCRISQL